MSSIVLTGGGTAGHCIPHLAILPYLKTHFDKIYYIGSKNGIEKEIIEKEKITYFSVPCCKLKRKFDFSNLKIPFVLLSGIISAGEILDKIKPDVIFSKGGYVSIPTVIAGKNRNIPIVAHESDFTVGLANKISQKFCNKILTSFPETAKTIKNGEYVGPPIRSEIFNVNKTLAENTFSFKNKKPVLLVLGGSQGSKKINQVVRECLPELLKKFNVLHVCGKGNLDNSIIEKNYLQIEYTHEIEKAYAVCSVCVSRAGSNVLFELLALKIPCVLIPLPKDQSRGDQLVNALYFQKLGLVSVLEQNAITPYSLYNYVTCAYENRHNLEHLFARFPVTDKSRQISRIIYEQAKK